ncbi:MAG: endopeptidase La [Proteobacteria bacterium]|nr:endopeptidase La [Pseudomonadota bacterium]
MESDLDFESEKNQYPLLPLRDVVVFPHMVIPLFVGRPKSIKALEAAMEADKHILLVAQTSAGKDDPLADDLYKVGSVANILQMLKLPDGTVKVLVEGLSRVGVENVADNDDFFVGTAQKIATEDLSPNEVEAMRRTVMGQFEQFVKLNKKIPAEVLTSISGIEEAGRVADTIAAHLPLKVEQKQEVLEISGVKDRMDHLLSLLEGELDILQVERKIRGRVKRQMEKSQREYYLNEQVKAIQKELGDNDEGADLDELEKKVKGAQMPKEARKKADSEMKKLKLMAPMSAEATVVRNYIDILVGLPWRKKSKINNSLKAAETILNEDHFGLEKVKERIIEYLAVQQRVDKVKAPILCLVGAPGVGKTSLGQSIARATNRKFIRMSLGGVRDESEIRGHRRTYIGSMPGKILQNLAKAKVKNPLFLLDEVDKMGMDFRGDPASALLEVLDPEQNSKFVDHYVELDYDLSDVMFVATANTMKIPAPLLDRMEVIRLEGYTEDEKINIASRYLLPKQQKNNGLRAEEFNLSSGALKDIVRYYTREAGVRGLEREISKICRKIVRSLLTEASKSISVTSKSLGKYLGVRKHSFGLVDKDNQIGQVTGLAWTEVGGELLTVEAAIMPGKGVIQRTGSLGDVMKESVEAARSVVRSRAQHLGIPDKVLEGKDIHVHVPEGATPKDGPSAGIAITTSLVSAITRIPVKSEVAMTGEITLRGEVLAIGGLKEKLLAAQRGGIKQVLIPEQNNKDLAEIPAKVKSRLEIIPVKWIDQVLELSLERMPEPLPEEAAVPLTSIESGSSETTPAIQH